MRAQGCRGPGEGRKHCGRETVAKGLCSAHYVQVRRALGSTAALRPLRLDQGPKVEARGKISESTATKVRRIGVSSLKKGGLRALRDRDPLYRGTQVILEAFGRGEFTWKKRTR